MKYKIRKIWRLSFYVVLGIVLVACASQAPEVAVSTEVQESLVEPTETNPSPAETQESHPSATNTEPTQTQTVLTPTQTALAPTETVTATSEPTPIPCDGVITSSQQEGPFFSPGSPERGSLIEEGMLGVPVLIIGRVFDQDCNPIPGAKLDFWLADVNGEYDNAGYTLRGHVFTNEEGFYTLESIEPTSYTGRPPHIHVKVYAPSGEELLTTQMYFAGSEDSTEVRNAPDLYANYLEPDRDGRQQTLFNFVVNY